MPDATPRPPREAPIAFLHVMKCGGTSVRAALQTAADRSMTRVFELDGKENNRAARRIRIPTWSMRDAMLVYALHDPRVRVAMGHFRYDEYAHGRELERAHFVTLLRDPFERFVSLFLFRRFNRTMLRTSPHLDALLTDREGEAVRWGATYVELFRGGLEPHDRPVDEGDVEAACTNLDRFSVVGCLEHLPAFASALRAATGLPVTVGRENPGAAPSAAREELLADDRAVERIRELCEPDRLVYDWIHGRVDGAAAS
jgi:hypothetical protein